MNKLGAHQSIEGGYTKALDRIKKIGGNCLQIFSTSPRGWNFSKIDTVQIIQFIEAKGIHKIDPIYFHASYLINLAKRDKIGSLSKLSLISELTVASKLNIKGSIVHLGSFKQKTDNQTLFEENKSQYDDLSLNVKEILDKTPDNTLFIIENAGNRKVGKDLTEIAYIIKRISNKRVKVCLDTCHLHSAGYDITSPQKLDNFLLSFDRLIGLKKIEVIHVNDSRDPFNSGRDRHENIGSGTIGHRTFRLLLNHPKTRHFPFIIETPGFDQKGPDKKNLDVLKSLTDN
ncbi:deoxyribonuclease IV [Candidatus Roizmanbacteria bacterium]|nr:deoxyribonuclease IV [Candidatus Roizmanbacteria bacterium]